MEYHQWLLLKGIHIRVVYYTPKTLGNLCQHKQNRKKINISETLFPGFLVQRYSLTVQVFFTVCKNRTFEIRFSSFSLSICLVLLLLCRPQKKATEKSIRC